MNAVAPIATQAPVVERIASAVRDPAATSAALQALWDEAAEMRRGMGEAEADCMKQALDPSNSVAEARASRNSAEDFAHEGRRLEAALASIDEILPTIATAEHRAKILPAYLTCKKERIEFALRLAKRWPALVEEMVELIKEIERFDQTPPCEIPSGEDPLRTSVEAMARGCDANFHAFVRGVTGIRPVLRFQEARIPNFEATAETDRMWAWNRR